MSECSFTIAFSGTAAQVVQQVRSQVMDQNGSFNGDENSGNLSVKVLGATIQANYTISGSNLNVTITDKPFFLGCGQIESFIKSHIST